MTSHSDPPAGRDDLDIRVEMMAKRIAAGFEDKISASFEEVWRFFAGVLRAELNQEPAPAGRDDLRDRIADALKDVPTSSEFLRIGYPNASDRLHVADAVLAELRPELDMLGVYDKATEVLDGTIRFLHQRAEQAEELLRELIDDGDCSYDHHGQCQAHSLDYAPCPHASAKELLATLGQPAKEET